MRNQCWLLICVSLGLSLFFTASARADIYQWEYIDPSNPSAGRRQSATLATDGAGAVAAAGANLSYRDLGKAYLPGATLDNANFSFGSLFNADLTGASLTSATLSNLNAGSSILVGANLTQANLTFTDLDYADFTAAHLNQANLNGASMEDANFAGADLTGSIITNSHFFGAKNLTAVQLYSTASYQSHDLSGVSFGTNYGVSTPADLTGFDFSGQKLGNAIFDNVDLTGANFANAQIQGTYFFNVTGLTAAQILSTKSYHDHNLSGGSIVYVNMSGIDLSDQDLANTNLNGSNLSNANLHHANLTNAYLQYTSLAGADLSDASLTGAYLESLTTIFAFTAAQLYSTASYKNHTLIGLDLSHNNLSGWDFSNQTLTNSSFLGAILTGANFSGADVKGIDLGLDTTTNYSNHGTGISPAQLSQTASYQNRDLSGTSFVKNTLDGISLVGQNLTGCNFQSASLKGADLSNANLTNVAAYSADFTGANFHGSNLTGGYFSGANFQAADLSNAKLIGANLQGTNVNLATFTNADIRGANLYYVSLTPAQLMSTFSYQIGDLSNIDFSYAFLFAGVSFANENLTNVNFFNAALLGSDFTGAQIDGATFYVDSSASQIVNFSAAQLYSTASYQSHDLNGVKFIHSYLAGWNFAGQNLTGAAFTDACNLTGATFTDAIVRNASFSDYTYSNSEGLIFYEATLTAAQLYSTASYKNHDLSGIDFTENILSGWNFSGQNLRNAIFENARVDGADFTNADVRGASFAGTTNSGFTEQQLDSTASYQSHDLTGIQMMRMNLAGSNFANQNLTNAAFGIVDDVRFFMQSATNLTGANFQGAILVNANFTDCAVQGVNFKQCDLRGAYLDVGYNYENPFQGADFSDADLRGAQLYDGTSGAILTNTIQADGTIHGLNLSAGERLTVRNYPAGPSPFINDVPQSAPIFVLNQLTADPTSTLQIILDGDSWGSTISFAPGIKVALGGTLDLEFAGGVDVRPELGRTFDLFDWTGVNPTGTFAVSSPYLWDLSHLYTTGEVTLRSLLIPGDINNDGNVSAADISALMAALSSLSAYEATQGLTDTELLRLADVNGDGKVSNADLQALIALVANNAGAGGMTAVPEPGTFVLFAIVFPAFISVARRYRVTPAGS